MKKTILKILLAIVLIQAGLFCLGALGLLGRFYFSRTQCEAFSAEDYREACPKGMQADLVSLLPHAPGAQCLLVYRGDRRNSSARAYLVGPFQQSLTDAPGFSGGDQQRLGEFVLDKEIDSLYPFEEPDEELFSQILTPRFGIAAAEWRGRWLAKAQVYSAHSPLTNHDVYLCVLPDGGPAIVKVKAR